MAAKRFMFIAGEPSGDALAAELARALAASPKLGGFEFFGAGGAKMAAAGVELAFDMTEHAVIGLWEVLKNLRQFNRLFDQLVDLAFEFRPDFIVCVDFFGFNRRFARRIRWELEVRGKSQWSPRIVQYVSPQVWASRSSRARALARDFDLLLTLFPFEKAWYAEHVPGLRVEFVGHPIQSKLEEAKSKMEGFDSKTQNPEGKIVLLPGSRVGELNWHLPVMLGALQQIRSARPGVGARMILPDERLANLARRVALAQSRPGENELLEIQCGGLDESLAQADLAIASTGTVTMECACFGVPTVALYKTSWSTYQIARRIIQVKYLAMPNLLADELIFPEFLQHDATPANIARAALDLLADETRRHHIKTRLAEIVRSLGGPGASSRAAEAILKLSH